jgi:hypothetical protein
MIHKNNYIDMVFLLVNFNIAARFIQYYTGTPYEIYGYILSFYTFIKVFYDAYRENYDNIGDDYSNKVFTFMLWNLIISMYIVEYYIININYLYSSIISKGSVIILYLVLMIIDILLTNLNKINIGAKMLNNLLVIGRVLFVSGAF